VIKLEYGVDLPWSIFFGEGVEAGDWGVEVLFEEEAEATGNTDARSGLRFFVDPTHEVEISGGFGVEVALHSGEFGGLVFGHVFGAAVAGKKLATGKNGGYDQSNFEGLAGKVDVAAPE